MVQNYMETLVREALQRELAENAHNYPDLCLCPACLVQIQVHALNHLDPFYITCVAGEVYGEFRSREVRRMSEVMVSVTRAIEEVRSSSACTKQLA